MTYPTEITHAAMRVALDHLGLDDLSLVRAVHIGLDADGPTRLRVTVEVMVRSGGFVVIDYDANEIVTELIHIPITGYPEASGSGDA